GRIDEISFLSPTSLKSGYSPGCKTAHRPRKPESSHTCQFPAATTADVARSSNPARSMFHIGRSIVMECPRKPSRSYKVTCAAACVATTMPTTPSTVFNVILIEITSDGYLYATNH